MLSILLFRQEMIQKQKKAQNHINSLQFGKPWKTDEVDDKVTYIFAPTNVPESGSTFHCVTYNTTSGLLASYVTKLYKPVEIPCSRVISCATNFAGTKLVFMLLFPKAEPQEAHVSFVIINLESEVTVSKNYIHIRLSNEDYVKCLYGDTCSFGISHAIGSTGSEYIVTIVNSTLTAVSMTTGNEVMAEYENGWVGCHLRFKKGQIPPTSKVQVTSTCKGLQVLLYARRSNSAILLQVSDENTQEQRIRTWTAFQKWINVDKYDERTPAALQTMKQLTWTFEGHCDVHVQCFMESLVLDVIDDAIQLVDGAFTNEQRQMFHAENIQIPFLRKTLQYSEDTDGKSVSAHSDRETNLSAQWE